MKALLLMTFLASLLVLLSIPAHAQSFPRTPSLQLRDIQGRRINLADYKGKVVLINFWATWCPPCRAEIPDLIKIQRRYRKDGLRILGVTYPPQKLADVRRFARQVGMNYPIALGRKTHKARFTSSETLPVTVVIDRDGTVRGTIEGVMYADEFDEKIKPLIFSPTSFSLSTSEAKSPS